LKPSVGYCDIHPDEPAVIAYTGPETGQQPKRMCKVCWDQFRHKGKKQKED
jgi:hypothetical protein